MYPDDTSDQKMCTFSSMSPEMEEIAAEICIEVIKQHDLEEDCAEAIKKVKITL